MSRGVHGKGLIAEPYDGYHAESIMAVNEGFAVVVLRHGKLLGQGKRMGKTVNAQESDGAS